VLRTECWVRASAIELYLSLDYETFTSH
jgi:hypothetical protein